MHPGPRLSVVVPVYNVERYLPQCLDSLVAQTRPIDEILLVDDGCTDGCPGIMREYAARWPAMRVIRRDNAGAAAARNAGLDQATGDWIGFVDADDWIEPDMYARLLDLALRHDLDMALCNGRYHFEGREPDYPVYTDPPLCGPLGGGEWLAHKLENRTFLHMVWMHLYRRRFIEENELRFVEGLMHEDVIWSTRALVLAQRVAYDDTPLYVYRKTVRRLAPADLDRRLLRVIASAKIDAGVLAGIADRTGEPRLARAIRWQLVDGGLSVFHKIRQLSSPELRRAQWRRARSDGYLALLWRNATEFRQKRKIAARFLRALAAAAWPA